MSNPARMTAEAALRARKLDRTLTTALPLAGTPVDGAATGLPELDQALQGGVPRGQLSEIAGAQSSGRTTMLLQMMGAATRRGEMAALVDAFDRLDVPSAVAAGVVLDRLLWIRAQAPTPDALVERALKALNLVLQAGHVGLVALDLADAPPATLNRIPCTTWLRVQRVLEGSDTACVLVVPQPLARSAGGLTLLLTGRARWAGAAPRSRRVDGLDMTVRIVAPRGRGESLNLRARVLGCSGA